jgi:hypothetical protein
MVSIANHRCCLRDGREPTAQGDIEARDWYDDLWGWGMVYIDSTSGSVTLTPNLICASSIEQGDRRLIRSACGLPARFIRKGWS